VQLNNCLKIWEDGRKENDELKNHMNKERNVPKRGEYFFPDNI
jgi:hypothetical protein